jgi:hypothetical protein
LRSVAGNIGSIAASDGVDGEPPGILKPLRSQGCAASGFAAIQAFAAASSSSGVATTSSTMPSSFACAGRSRLPSSRMPVSAGRDPEHADRPDDAARPRQQAERHLGEAEPALRRVERDPVVAGERDLEPAAERRPVDRRDHRPPAGLQPAQHALDRLDVLEGRGRGALAGAGGHLVQVAAHGEHRLAEVTTTPVTSSRSASRRSSAAVNAACQRELSVFVDSSGSSIVRTTTPSSPRS